MPSVARSGISKDAKSRTVTHMKNGEIDKARNSRLVSSDGRRKRKVARYNMHKDKTEMTISLYLVRLGYDFQKHMSRS